VGGVAAAWGKGNPKSSTFSIESSDFTLSNTTVTLSIVVIANDPKSTKSSPIDIQVEFSAPSAEEIDKGNTAPDFLSPVPAAAPYDCDVN
jgi:hypothetical protein